MGRRRENCIHHHSNVKVSGRNGSVGATLCQTANGGCQVLECPSRVKSVLTAWKSAHFPQAERPLLVDASTRPSRTLCNRVASSGCRNGFAIIGHLISVAS